MAYKLKPYLLSAEKKGILLEIRGTPSYEDLPNVNYRAVRNIRQRQRRLRQLERKKARRLLKINIKNHEIH